MAWSSRQLFAGALLALAFSSLALAAAPSLRRAPLPVERFGGMRFRSIGPYRGGRVCAVTGVRGQPATFYAGSTGGGVWKTSDGGTTWEPISDRDFTTGSIGAVAVAPSDPNVVYVGTGESQMRANLAAGGGLVRPTDPRTNL